MKAPLNPEGKRNWPLTLCGCMGYKNLEGKSQFCPLFCPLALLCTNGTIGRVWTLYTQETPCCFRLGPQGCCLCLLTLPCSIYFPCHGLICLGCINNVIREQVIQKYNVKEEAFCDEKNTCGKCCNCMHINCNYPCSFFQMEMALLEWESSV